MKSCKGHYKFIFDVEFGFWKKNWINCHAWNLNITDKDNVRNGLIKH